MYFSLQRYENVTKEGASETVDESMKFPTPKLRTKFTEGAATPDSVVTQEYETNSNLLNLCVSDTGEKVDTANIQYDKCSSSTWKRRSNIHSEESDDEEETKGKYRNECDHILNY